MTPTSDADGGSVEPAADAPAEQPRRAVGRPRDDSVDRKLIDAAIAQYAEHGWAKFSFEAVANRAGVGKPAVYLRFGSRSELLVSAFEQSVLPDAEIDTGSLRGDLLEFAKAQFRFWLSPIGNASLRISVDQIYMTELGEAYRGRVVAPLVRATRHIVERGKVRGEIGESTDTNLVLEAISGAVRTRVTDTRLASRPRLFEMIDEYCEQLLDLVLRDPTPGEPAARR
jgi:AcrR family transcriptional regulator